MQMVKENSAFVNVHQQLNENMMEAAYANIGLDANAIWREGPGDSFQKCSDELWVKLNYLKEKKHHQVGEKGKVVTVHDVIPESRLTSYGNFCYDNDREMMYNREKYLEEHFVAKQENLSCEPWMLPQVEHEFRKLIRNCSQPYNLYNGFKPVDCVQVEESIQKKYPILAKKCQPCIIDSEETLETIQLPNPFYRIDDLNQLELQMRITSTKHIWDHQISTLNREYGMCQNKSQPAVIFCSSLPVSDSSGEAAHFQRFSRTEAKIFPILKKRSGKPENWSGENGNLVRVPEAILKWLHTNHPTRCKEFQTLENLNDQLGNIRDAIQETNQESDYDTSSFGQNNARPILASPNPSSSSASSASENSPGRTFLANRTPSKCRRILRRDDLEKRWPSPSGSVSR